ncbi:MAG TPA: hypothetical protein VGG64_21460 [Pirellulales bacterium]|jgi:YHS domain-containing protein
MDRVFSAIFLSMGVCLALQVAGCSKTSAPPKVAAPPQATTAAPADDEAAEIAASMALLPEAERAVAEAQKNCPVGDAALGSMGMPFKVSVKGRDVYLCCEGCKSSIEQDPDKYLAKLDAKAK